jgi:hypothetical protein
VFASTIEATEADDQVPQGGEIFGSMSGVGGRAILAEGDITDVMNRIFDRPVTAAKSLDLSGVHFGGRATGEEDFHFFGDAKRLEMMSGAVDHRRLEGVRETRAFRSDLERVDLAGFMAAMALAQSDVRRGKKRRSRPWKGRRVCRRASVDCL